MFAAIERQGKWGMLILTHRVWKLHTVLK